MQMKTMHVQLYFQYLLLSMFQIISIPHIWDPGFTSEGVYLRRQGFISC